MAGSGRRVLAVKPQLPNGSARHAAIRNDLDRMCDADEENSRFTFKCFDINKIFSNYCISQYTCKQHRNFYTGAHSAAHTSEYQYEYIISTVNSTSFHANEQGWFHEMFTSSRTVHKHTVQHDRSIDRDKVDRSLTHARSRTRSIDCVGIL